MNTAHLGLEVAISPDCDVYNVFAQNLLALESVVATNPAGAGSAKPGTYTRALQRGLGKRAEQHLRLPSNRLASVRIRFSGQLDRSPRRFSRTHPGIPFWYTPDPIATAAEPRSSLRRKPREWRFSLVKNL